LVTNEEMVLEKARQDGRAVNKIVYKPIPTIEQYLNSSAQIRGVVGPRGSGKTSGAAWDVCHYIPSFLKEKYGILKTRGVIVRNTYTELTDTTMKTVFEWFPWGKYIAQSSREGSKIYRLRSPEGFEVEILFRSCDRPEDVKKFKSMEVTWYWIDESIEIAEQIKLMLKSSIGRYPPRCPVQFGIETTNPPDVEMPMYHQFSWNAPPPGPKPIGDALESHEGFWQPPYENEANLRPGYYDDLKDYYADQPDWLDMYVLGKPGIIMKGRSVYNNFRREIHESKEPLVWTGGLLIRGWDNSGNCPACVVIQVPDTGRCQVLREFHTDRDGIVDFTRRVVNECNMLFPGAEYIDWGDPAGAAKYSKREGGFTSNAKLMLSECGVDVKSSEQNLTARISSVQHQVNTIDGILIDPSCIRLINGFIGGYCYPEIGRNSGIFGDKPEKNRFSHPHDSLQYVLVKLFGAAKSEKIELKIKHREPAIYESNWMR